MNLQEAVGKVVSRLKDYYFRQGMPFSIDTNGCAYRGIVDGKETRCAIGCLMPNFAIPEKWEGSPIDVIYTRMLTTVNDTVVPTLKVQMVAEGLWPDDEEYEFVNILLQIQKYHDSAAMVYWSDEGKKVFYKNLINLCETLGIEEQ